MRSALIVAPPLVSARQPASSHSGRAEREKEGHSSTGSQHPDRLHPSLPFFHGLRTVGAPCSRCFARSTYSNDKADLN